MDPDVRLLDFVEDWQVDQMYKLGIIKPGSYHRLVVRRDYKRLKEKLGSKGAACEVLARQLCISEETVYQYLYKGN